jgi:hypothetical protein
MGKDRKMGYSFSGITGMAKSTGGKELEER